MDLMIEWCLSGLLPIAVMYRYDLSVPYMVPSDVRVERDDPSTTTSTSCPVSTLSLALGNCRGAPTTGLAYLSFSALYY